MKVRSTAALAALLLASAAGSAQAQGFEYAAGASRYKIVSTQKMTQEAMGQKQDIDINGEQLITLDVAKKAKDTLAVSVTLDSISLTNSMMGAMDVSKAKGAKVTSLISPRGIVYSTTVPDSGAAADIGDELARILPRIGSSLAVGATWVDTLSGKVKRNGIDMDRTVISTSKVVGDTTYGGEKAWKIERVAATTMSGNGSAQGQPISMEGTSNGTGFIYVSPSGAFLGGDTKDEAKMKITLVANGMEIGMTMQNSTQVSKVK